MIEYSSGTTFGALVKSGLNLGVVLIFAVLVVSSPILMLANPASVAASSSSESIDPTGLAPSTLSQGGDFAAQAPLQIPRSFQSTDIVSSTGIYEVTFITSTTGSIDKIRMDFPADTNIGASGVIERVGIGTGTLTKVGNLLIYDVQTPVNIPAGTFIRLEISGIKNPTIPSNSLTVAITTTDIGNVVIDGPSQTNAYKMKRIGVNELAVNAVTTQKIADGAITSTKPAESFMKKVYVDDDPAGNAVGWDPDGATTEFTVTDSAIGSPLDTFVSFHIADVSFITAYNCQVLDTSSGQFFIKCEFTPPNGTTLQYVVTNLLGNCVSQTGCF